MKLKILYNILVFGLVGAIFLAGLPLKTEAASAGALDPTFGGDGKVITNIVTSETPNDVVIQPDGKIIVVGEVPSAGGSPDFFVIRYEPDGSLDTTFSLDGIVTNNFGNDDAAFAVALQADGKIVVIGRTNAVSGSDDFAVARYLPNGSLDTTFSGDGRAVNGFGGDDTGRCVLIQADGKIVVGGNTDGDFGILRYNLDGTLDTTFSGDGRATFDHGGANNTGYDIKIQSDGKIVGAGGRDGDFIVYRVNSDGTADATFDGDGMVTTNFGTSNDSALSVAIQVDGRIVAGGFSGSSPNQSSALARYNTDGSLDSTFDGDGRLTVDFDPSFSESLRDIELQGDGKILAGVYSINGILLGNNAARFNTNGSLDLSFGNDGIVTTSVQSNTSTTAIAISGSEVVVVGDASDVVSARFNLNIKPTQSNDFDGDGFSDYAIFRPSTGTWYIMQSLTGAVRITGFGVNGDVPLDGDFDGDGLNDLAIYRPGAGEWWFQRSADLTVFAAQFGAPGDKPVPGDVDKDGKSDFIVWRPANGNYFALRSSSNFSSFFSFPFGANGDVPVGTAIYP